MKRSRWPQISALVGAGASLIAILTWLGVRPPAIHRTPAAGSNPRVQRSVRKAAKAAPAVKTRALDAGVSPVSGSWSYEAGRVMAGGRLFEGYGRVAPEATFDSRVWRSFTVIVGVRDEAAPAAEFDVAVAADGDEVWNRHLQAGAKPVQFGLRLSGQSAITLRVTSAEGAEAEEVVWAEPRFAQ